MESFIDQTTKNSEELRNAKLSSEAERSNFMAQAFKETVYDEEGNINWAEVKKELGDKGAYNFVNNSLQQQGERPDYNKIRRLAAFLEKGTRGKTRKPGKKDKERAIQLIETIFGFSFKDIKGEAKDKDQVVNVILTKCEDLGTFSFIHKYVQNNLAMHREFINEEDLDKTRQIKERANYLDQILKRNIKKRYKEVDLNLFNQKKLNEKLSQEEQDLQLIETIFDFSFKDIKGQKEEKGKVVKNILTKCGVLGTSSVIHKYIQDNSEKVFEDFFRNPINTKNIQKRAVRLNQLFKRTVKNLYKEVDLGLFTRKSLSSDQDYKQYKRAGNKNLDDLVQKKIHTSEENMHNLSDNNNSRTSKPSLAFGYSKLHFLQNNASPFSPELDQAAVNQLTNPNPYRIGPISHSINFLSPLYTTPSFPGTPDLASLIHEPVSYKYLDTGLYSDSKLKYYSTQSDKSNYEDISSEGSITSQPNIIKKYKEYISSVSAEEEEEELAMQNSKSSSYKY